MCQRVTCHGFLLVGRRCRCAHGMGKIANFAEQILLYMKPAVYSFLALLSILWSCDMAVAPAPDLLELPAVTAQDNIVRYQGYVSSYNTTTLIPNWVAYELTADETYGDATREDKIFSMDMNFKGKQARREDYRQSGWTKGHMAPAGDFFWSDEAMAETFYFMNICPQKEELNNKDWQYLEKQVRRWAREFGKVWVVTGPIIGDNKYGTIGDNHVIIPDAFFKVVLAKDGDKYQSIGFVMQNDKGRYYLEKCAISADDLELMTGYDFYPALPDDIEEKIESNYNLAFWDIDYKR